MYSESMKNIAKVSAPSRNLTMFAPVSVRRRVKIPSGTSGAFERCSIDDERGVEDRRGGEDPDRLRRHQPLVFACVSA